MGDTCRDYDPTSLSLCISHHRGYKHRESGEMANQQWYWWMGQVKYHILSYMTSCQVFLQSEKSPEPKPVSHRMCGWDTTRKHSRAAAVVSPLRTADKGVIVKCMVCHNDTKSKRDITFDRSSRSQSDGWLVEQPKVE